MIYPKYYLKHSTTLFRLVIITVLVFAFYSLSISTGNEPPPSVATYAAMQEWAQHNTYEPPNFPRMILSFISMMVLSYYLHRNWSHGFFIRKRGVTFINH